MGITIVESSVSHGPAHPIAVMESIAYATPCPCEGSLGHLRQDVAWETRDDHRRAGEGDEELLGEFAEVVTLDEIRASCTKDAVNAIVRWTAAGALA